LARVRLKKDACLQAGQTHLERIAVGMFALPISNSRLAAEFYEVAVLQNIGSGPNRRSPTDGFRSSQRAKKSSACVNPRQAGAYMLEKADPTRSSIPACDPFKVLESLRQERVDLGLSQRAMAVWLALESPARHSCFDGTVVEIESVNVEGCLHAVTSPFDAEFRKNAGANSEEPAPRPAVETDRRDVRIEYTALSRSVKYVFCSGS